MSHVREIADAIHSHLEPGQRALLLIVDEDGWVRMGSDFEEHEVIGLCISILNGLGIGTVKMGDLAQAQQN